MGDTANLLDELCGYFRRFLILHETQLHALALWTMHTYVYEIADTTPYLIVTSAEKRSGKTRVIECLQHVAHKPKTVTALTEAVLFRFVSQVKPTLLVDETDTIFRESRSGPSERQEGLRAVLNAGYRRGTTIPRVLPTGDIAEFECFCPKLLAGIGHLPDTIEDRGLAIRLTRKLPTDEVERFRFREVANGTTQALRDALAEWAPFGRLQLDGARPTMPEELDDRAQDSYEILLAIAELASPAWATRARAALIALRNEADAERESQGIRLLHDVLLCATTLERMARIATVDLLALLYQEGEQPWEEWWGEAKGKRAARRLALALGEYGLKPTRFQELGVQTRGYATAPLLEAAERYTVSDTATRQDALNDAGLRAIPHGNSEGSVAVSESGDLQGDCRVAVSNTQESLPAERGSEEWLGKCSARDLAEWSAEQLEDA